MQTLTRHQVLLYAGDFSKLGEYYSSKSTTEVIRELVRRHIVQCEQRVQELKQKDKEHA